MFTSLQVDTPLGPLLAIADDKALHFLGFADDIKIQRLTHVSGDTEPLRSIQRELNAYFDGNLREFKTPIVLDGSPFQKLVWQALVLVSYGETKSYAEQAKMIGRPSAYRAVGHANAANNIAIVIPCHRIINSNGGLCGYAYGTARKQWLINHERAHKEMISASSV